MSAFNTYFAIISKALGVQMEKFLYGVFLAVYLSSVSTCNVAEENEASIPGTNSQSLLAENSIILVQAIYTKLEGKKKKLFDRHSRSAKTILTVYAST